MKTTARTRFSKRDLTFYVGEMFGRTPCGICGTKTRFDGLSVELEMPLKKTNYGIEHLCPACLTSSPKRLAELARDRATRIEGKRVNRRSGDDEDMYVRMAVDLRNMAGLLEQFDNIDEIPNGILARKIGEAFLEMDGPPKADNADGNAA